MGRRHVGPSEERGLGGPTRNEKWQRCVGVECHLEVGEEVLAQGLADPRTRLRPRGARECRGPVAGLGAECVVGWARLHAVAVG